MERRALYGEPKTEEHRNLYEALDGRDEELIDGVYIRRKLAPSRMPGIGERKVPILKIVLVGESVGKSKLVDAWGGSDVKGPTVGVEGHMLNVVVSGQVVKVVVWDTSSQQKYFEVRNEFFKDATVALVCCSPSVPSSISSLPKWRSEVLRYGKDQPHPILVNLLHTTTPAPTPPELTKFSSSFAISLYTVNLKTGDGAKELLNTLAANYSIRR
eukprot:TRINITY_DN12607_c0_g1_i1.p1 TRINITY_DN12607_c0_g1~~TRINITY_DN12607_c0_g1_i1.p1  ORF type:complete len:214 (+),score=28.78 TRINITY_DN12607_c0_g1_i1:31-672(+)